MRERTLKVDVAKLISLSDVYKPSKIAEKLNISRQRWNNYKTGRHDMPESVVDVLCANYGLNKNDLVAMS